MLDAEEAVGAALHEADLAVAADGVAHVIAVVPRVVHAEHVEGLRFGLGGFEVADAGELVADDAGLEAELLRVVDVLELATATAAEVAAGSLDAVLGGAEHEDGGGLEEAGGVVCDLGDDAFAGDGVLDEDDATVLGVSDRAAAVGEAGEFELDRDERAGCGRASPCGGVPSGRAAAPGAWGGAAVRGWSWIDRTGRTGLGRPRLGSGCGPSTEIDGG